MKKTAKTPQPYKSPSHFQLPNHFQPPNHLQSPNPQRVKRRNAFTKENFLKDRVNHKHLIHQTFVHLACYSKTFFKAVSLQLKESVLSGQKEHCGHSILVPQTSLIPNLNGS